MDLLLHLARCEKSGKLCFPSRSRAKFALKKMRKVGVKVYSG